MKKRTASLLLALFLTLSMCLPAYAAGELSAVWSGGALDVRVDGVEEITAGTEYLILIAAPDGTLFYMTSALAGEDGVLAVSLTNLPEFDATALAAGSYRISVADVAFHVLAEGKIPPVKSSPGSGSVSSGSSTAVRTFTNPDGTVTRQETRSNGNVTETTTAKDGSVATLKFQPDGTMYSAKLEISEQALKTALESGVPIPAPIVVPVAARADKNGVFISVTLPAFEWKADKIADLPEVEIGITGGSVATVAYLLEDDGSLTLIKECRIGNIIVPVEQSCELLIADNDRHFDDVPEDAWYSDAVRFVTAREIFNGVGDKRFAPGMGMNRAMAAQIIYNYDRYSVPGVSSGFQDIQPEDWYADAVAWNARQEIVKGYGALFGPLDDITREDLVTILYRYAGYSGYNVSAEKPLDSFTDADAVLDYARAAMRWAVAAGLLVGYEDGTIRPTNPVTRAEVAAIMYRYVNSVKNRLPVQDTAAGFKAL